MIRNITSSKITFVIKKTPSICMYICIYISKKMGYVIKKNKIMPWMDLEIIIQSELSQKEKNHIIIYMCNSKNES